MLFVCFNVQKLLMCLKWGNQCDSDLPGVMLQKRSGDEALKALGYSRDFRLTELLDANPEFESSLESTQQFLINQDLQCLAA